RSGEGGRAARARQSRPSELRQHTHGHACDAASAGCPRRAGICAPYAARGGRCGWWQDDDGGSDAVPAAAAESDRAASGGGPGYPDVHPSADGLTAKITITARAKDRRFDAEPL